MPADRDPTRAERLRREHLDHTGAEIDYFAGLNRQVLGYEPPEVVLLHDDRLNGDVIEEVLKRWRWHGERKLAPSFERVRAGAARGEAEAEYYLGSDYYYGYGVKRDYSEL